MATSTARSGRPIPAAGSSQPGRRRSMRAYCGTRLMRVAVLTTSYPRHEGDVAGAFVRDAVRHLRAAGVEVRVVSPAGFRDFGIAYGDGIAANLSVAPGAGGAAAGVRRLVRAGRAARRAGCRPRPRALAALGLPGARDREAVRPPGLGNGRRARRPRAGALPPAHSRARGGRRAVPGSRRGGHAAWVRPTSG